MTLVSLVSSECALCELHSMTLVSLVGVNVRCVSFIA